MPRGIFKLGQVDRKTILGEWESPDNVWIYPDGESTPVVSPLDNALPKAATRNWQQKNAIPNTTARPIL